MNPHHPVLSGSAMPLDLHFAALRTPRFFAAFFFPLVLLVLVFSPRLVLASAGSELILPVKIVPGNTTIRARDTGRTVKFVLLLSNNSMEDRSVPVAFVSSNPEVLPNPAPIEVFVPGKKKAHHKPALGRARFDVVIPPNAFGIASLSAVIGSNSSAPSSIALKPSTIEGHAQFFKAPAEGLLEAQACQLTRGRVTAYWPDGSVVARGRLSSSGSFVLSNTGNPARFRKRAAGLAKGEIRVFVDLPNGSTLMADSDQKFIQVSPLTTVLSMARRNRAGLTLDQAEAALRSYFDLPDSLSLEDFGGEVSPFSEADFMAAARAWNQDNKKPLEDIDLFVEEVEDGVQDHADGQVTAIEPFRDTIDAAPLLGIADDNTDPLGSMDPDQFQGLAGEELAVFDPKSEIFKAKKNYGTVNSILSFVGTSTMNLGVIVARFEGAKEWKNLGAAGHWGLGLGLTSIATQITNLVIALVGATEPDPVIKGLETISSQIEALSKKLDQAAAKAAFDAEKRTTQDSYNQLLARLNSVSTTLQTRTTDPRSALPFQEASKSIAFSTAVGSQASITLANSMLGISGSENGVALFHKMLTSRFDMTAAIADGERMHLPFRSNENLLEARYAPMRYINMLTTALQVSSEEARVHMNLYGSPAQRLKGLKNSLEQATPAFGSNGLAALRRRALQQVPPRFSSSEIFVDSTRGDAGRGLVWSREVMVRAFDNTTVKRYPKSGSWYRRDIDGEKFKPGSYRLNDKLPAGAGWRLPTLAELQSLPGWGKGDAGLRDLASQTGIDPKGRHWFAVYDPSAPNPYYFDKQGGLGSLFGGYASGQVRFYSFHNGNEVNIVDATRNITSPDTANCLRVLDLNTYPGTAEVPTFAWPDDPSRKPSWWPAKAYKSSLMRSAGIPPTNIVVIDNTIPNPWYSANASVGREVPTHVRVLSALAYWELKPSGSETRGMVEDVSGLVEWQSSDSDAAMVGNTFSRFDEAAEPAQTAGKFVSPWFAPITFSRENVPVTFTANWIQQLGSATPSNKVTITQAADASLCLPPVVFGLDVTPGNLKYTRASDINDKVDMSATLYKNDRTAEDATNEVVWSLQLVTKDGSGNETTSPFPADLASISQGSGGGTGGKLTVHPDAGLPARTLRVVATDPATGRTGKADLLLQF